MKNRDLHSIDLYQNKRGKFIYTYPRNTITYRRNLPIPPYPEAPIIEWNPYYWWFQFLLRSERYKTYCQTKRGTPELGGRFAPLHKHWGNIFEESDFFDWWKRHQSLFMESPERKLCIASTVNNSSNTITIEVPLELDTTYLISRFKRLLRDQKSQRKKENKPSTALYPIYEKPVLTALYRRLAVYDMWAENPKIKKWEIAEALNIKVYDGAYSYPQYMEGNPEGIVRYQTQVKKRKQGQKVYKLLAEAKAIIQYVEQGQFPRRA